MHLNDTTDPATPIADRGLGQVARTTLLLLAAALVSACGSDGGGSAGSGWQAGVFESSETFAARCAVPRTGIDPFTGRNYVDRQGSTSLENHFLRSYSNETYLWYDEIPDLDPRQYDDPLEYFELLKTSAVTPSGQAQDRFHFTVPSDEWFQLSQSGVSVSYGMTLLGLSTTPPRDYVIAFVEPGSPAASAPANLARGARILAVDGVDIDASSQAQINILNAGLFPDDANETHTFEVRDAGAIGSRTVTLTSAALQLSPVLNVKTIPTATGNVGYLQFNDHIATAEAELVNAINFLQGQAINDLVIDLRYNGGGFLDIASQLAFMIAGSAQTIGRGFDTLQFNDKNPLRNPITGAPLAPTPFHSTTLGWLDPNDAGQALPSLNLTRVFLLTGPGTCSASEAIINGLRGINVEVLQFGSTTCGKPYGFYPTDNCGTTYFTIQFRGVNDIGFGDFVDGFSPQNAPGTQGVPVAGCSVLDDFDNPLGDPAEARLAAALAYRQNPGTCPAASGRPLPGKHSSEADAVLFKDPWRMNRILRQ